MAGVLIGDAHRELAERLVADNRLQVFAHVANSRCQGRGAFGPIRPVLEEMRVALEVGPAARGIDENYVGPLERGDVAFREPNRLLLVAGVRVQCTAAGLVRRLDDLDPEVREHARGRGVHVAVGRAHHAPEQQRDGGTRRLDLHAPIPRTAYRWRERVESPQARGEESTREPAQAGPF